ADKSIPAVLSATAGAADVISFLALAGLFTAHITGNVVIVAAHSITGRFAEIGPLLALPVFIAVLAAVTLASISIEKAGYSPTRGLLILQAVFLAASLGLAVAFGPFANVNCFCSVVVGMLAVAAMATQNALVKIAFPGSPSTAVMTTNATQLTFDLAVIARRLGTPEDLIRARHRATRTLTCVIGFA